MRIYIYNEGLARFATEEYKGPLNSNLNNFFMHLTNYAINKNSENFIFNSDENNADVGHKRSLASIWKKIDSMGGNSISVISQIEDIIVKTMCSVQPTLYNIYRASDPEGNKCFEVLGFDVILDHKLKPWLLEVNHTPSFTADTPFDYKIKFDLISNTIRLLNMSAERKKEYKELTRSHIQNRISRKIAVDIVPKPNWKEEGFLENEKKCIGNYKLIYPNAEKDYDKYIKTSRELLEECTGIKKKPSKEDTGRLSKSPIVKRDVIIKPKIKFQSPKPMPSICRSINGEDIATYETPIFDKIYEPNFQSFEKKSYHEASPLIIESSKQSFERKLIKLTKLPTPIKAMARDEKIYSESQSIIDKVLHKSDGKYIHSKVLEFFPKVGLTPMTMIPMLHKPKSE
jgi:hypothetical protein